MVRKLYAIDRAESLLPSRQFVKDFEKAGVCFVHCLINYVIVKVLKKFYRQVRVVLVNSVG